MKRCSQKFCKISKNTFSTEHLHATASVILIKFLLDSRQIYLEEYNRELPPLLDSTRIIFRLSLWSSSYTCTKRQDCNLFCQTCLFPLSLLSWKNPLSLDMLLSGSNWKTITLFSESIFTLIKKNVRKLSLGNNEYTRDEGFLEGLWRKLFFTRLISCYYFGFIGLLSLL